MVVVAPATSVASTLVVGAALRIVVVAIAVTVIFFEEKPWIIKDGFWLNPANPGTAAAIGQTSIVASLLRKKFTRARIRRQQQLQKNFCSQNDYQFGVMTAQNWALLYLLSRGGTARC